MTQTQTIDGSTKDYDFGQKNHWRRSLWNSILSRTEGSHKHLPVLYLCGPQDLDRQIATSKGVPHQNLIAVDKRKMNSDRVRSEGHPAINADIAKLLQSWPATQPISAAVLDLCGGLTNIVCDLASAHFRSVFSGSVVAINLLRGRDAASNDWRDRVAEIAHEEGIPVEHKNRSRMALMLYATHVGQCMLGRNLSDMPRPQHEFLANLISHLMQPQFFVYRSGTLVFDSVVFKAITVGDGENVTNAYNRLKPSHAPRLQMKCWWKQDDVESLMLVDESLRRRIVAMLAVRTRRLRSH